MGQGSSSGGGGGTGTGDVVGPASSVNNNIVTYDLLTGKLIKDGGETIAQVKADVIDDMELRPPATDSYDPTPNLPVGPSIGDRYISEATANGWTEDYVYTWNGAAWTEESPELGWMIWMLAELVLWVFYSGGWMEIGSDTFITGPAAIVNENILVGDGTSGVLAKDGGQTIAEVIAAAVAAAGAGIKGWITLNGTGAIAIIDSFNVTSITDNGTGDYTVTWDTDFANADYAVVGNAGGATGRYVAIGAVAAGTSQVTTQTIENIAIDDARVNVMAIGDQA